MSSLHSLFTCVLFHTCNLVSVYASILWGLSDVFVDFYKVFISVACILLDIVISSDTWSVRRSGPYVNICIDKYEHEG